MTPRPPVPGETPIDDFSGLLVKGITTRRELSVVEARNVLRATIRYLAGVPSADDAPFDFHWLLKLHREMFGDVWAWAGQPRKCDLNIGVPWYEVEPRLYDVTRNLPYWADLPAVEQAARLHHGAVHVHPFLNGNGRWARMLANVWLRRCGSRPTEWPEQTIGEGTSVVRGEYLEAIKAADAHDLQPLIELHRSFTPTDGS